MLIGGESISRYLPSLGLDWAPVGYHQKEGLEHIGGGKEGRDGEVPGAALGMTAV